MNLTLAVASWLRKEDTAPRATGQQGNAMFRAGVV